MRSLVWRSGVIIGPCHAARGAPTLMNTTPAVEAGGRGNCMPSDWAGAMGHAEKRKLRNNCK